MKLKRNILISVFVIAFLVSCRSAVISSAIHFSALDSQINQGECTMLEWDAAGAERVEINGDTVMENGQQQVCPQVTTNYFLYADYGDRQDSSKLTIQVGQTENNPSGENKIMVEFWADEETLTQGECTTLHWQSSRGPLFLDEDQQDNAGSMDVCPEQSREYYLEVGDELASRSVFITVEEGETDTNQQGQYAPASPDNNNRSPLAQPESPKEKPLSFTFSPDHGPGGTEVTLSLSSPAEDVMVIFNGRILPKRVLDGGMKLVITVPSNANSGFFELKGNNLYVKTDKQFFVGYVSDLAMVEYWAVPDANKPVKLIHLICINRGPDSINNILCEFSCSGQKINLQNGIETSISFHLKALTTIAVANYQGLTTDVELPDSSIYDFEITCYTECENTLDPVLSNNSINIDDMN